MSTKNIVESLKIFDDVSMVSDSTSSIVSVKSQDKAFIIIKWTGAAPVGTLTVQARNKKPTLGPDSDWVTVDMGSPILVSGNSGDHQLIFNQLPFTDLRIKYEATSGTGTLSAFLASKAVGV